jgi:gamma-glutamyltranspeptidase
MPNKPKGTSFLSILNKDSIVIILIITINLDFGLILYDTKIGIILNSEINNFSISLTRNIYDLEPSVYNEVIP